jgi:hypothetical protein
MKQILKSLVPRLFQPIRIADVILRHEARHGKIISGPFAGSKYVGKSVGSVFLPKVLGVYEKELHTAIYALQAKAIASIAIIGAAEGYYVIGFSKLFPHAKIFAYESEEEGRRLLAQNCALNNCNEKIKIEGFCDKKAFLDLLKNEAPQLIVMDIEGGEDELLNRDVLDLLKNSSMIVELHPWIAPGIKEKLIELLGGSHHCSVISSTQRTFRDIPINQFLARLFSRWLTFHVNEMRPFKMEWLLAEPLT